MAATDVISTHTVITVTVLLLRDIIISIILSVMITIPIRSLQRSLWTVGAAYAHAALCRHSAYVHGAAYGEGP
jgi:hypothetical protein